MGFTVDFSEFDKLKNAYKGMENDFNRFLRQFLVDMANKIISETKLKQTGHYGEKYKAFDTGAMTNAWEIGSIQGRGKELVVEIRNGMEYATEIEYGHRIVVGTGENKREIGWYDGRFMLKTSIDNIEKQMPIRFQLAFKKFCKDNGIK